MKKISSHILLLFYFYMALLPFYSMIEFLESLLSVDILERIQNYSVTDFHLHVLTNKRYESWGYSPGHSCSWHCSTSLWLPSQSCTNPVLQSLCLDCTPTEHVLEQAVHSVQSLQRGSAAPVTFKMNNLPDSWIPNNRNSHTSQCVIIKLSLRVK